MKGKNVLVAGLGRTGVATANRLAGLGARVTVTDAKTAGELGGNVERLDKRVLCNLGGYDGVMGVTFDLVVTSPGISWDSPLLAGFRRRKIEVISEIEIAFRLAGRKWVAITGTNGKTTTTSLVGAILIAAGVPCVVCGNIGNPVMGEERVFAGEAAVVAEISSFQLEGVETFAPAVSAILNITPDHLDRHGSMENYISLKSRIFARQPEDGVCVLNMDDPATSALKGAVPCRVSGFSALRELDEGAFLRGGNIIVAGKGRRLEIGPASDLRILGRPNLENALAACAVSASAGADAEAIRKALFSFAGVAHRMEVISRRKGVVYINDSKGTNVAASLKALEGLDSPVIMILGGRDKEGDFAPLADLVMKKETSVILIGEAADKIARSLSGYPEVSRAASMEEAVAMAASGAKEGDTVLLSPACASFDMFRNYEDRGERFRRAVLGLDSEGKGPGNA